MRELLVSRDESYALSVKIALDAAGIPSSQVRRNFDDAPMARGTTLFLVPERDYERARTVVASLQDTLVTDSRPGAPVVRGIALTVIVAVVGYGFWMLFTR